MQGPLVGCLHICDVFETLGEKDRKSDNRDF